MHAAFRPLDFIISIHALREEGDCWLMRKLWGCTISIHALREEGDLLTSGKYQDCAEISIHALREEGDATSPRTRT